MNSRKPILFTLLGLAVAGLAGVMLLQRSTPGPVPQQSPPPHAPVDPALIASIDVKKLCIQTLAKESPQTNPDLMQGICECSAKAISHEILASTYSTGGSAAVTALVAKTGSECLGMAAKVEVKKPARIDIRNVFPQLKIFGATLATIKCPDGYRQLESDGKPDAQISMQNISCEADEGNLFIIARGKFAANQVILSLKTPDCGAESVRKFFGKDLEAALGKDSRLDKDMVKKNFFIDPPGEIFKTDCSKMENGQSRIVLGIDAEYLNLYIKEIGAKGETSYELAGYCLHKLIDIAAAWKERGEMFANGRWIHVADDKPWIFLSASYEEAVRAQFQKLEHERQMTEREKWYFSRVQGLCLDSEVVQKGFRALLEGKK